MTRSFIGAVVIGSLGGVAFASHIPQVDPASVPYGAMVAQNQVKTPLKIKVGDQPSHRLPDGAVVYIRHLSSSPASRQAGTRTPGPLWSPSSVGR